MQGAKKRTRYERRGENRREGLEGVGKRWKNTKHGKREMILKQGEETRRRGGRRRGCTKHCGLSVVLPVREFKPAQCVLNWSKPTLSHTTPLSLFLELPTLKTHYPALSLPFSHTLTTHAPILQPLVESWHIQSCNSVLAVTRQSEHYFHLINVVWHRGLVPVAQHSRVELEERVKAKFAVSTWLGTLRLCIPCLFLCLATAMFPVRQEVSSVSCHRPLSCGHFLVLCQHHCVLLTQRTEVVLLAANWGRTEKNVIISGLMNQPSEIMSGCCLFS